MLLLFGVSSAATPIDTTFKNFISYIKVRSYGDEWDLYPLALFPILTAQHHPWTVACAGGYTSVQNYGNVACLQADGTCYIGSRTLQLPDSLYFYRSEKYLLWDDRWTFLEDYVVITDLYGKILSVLKRDSIDGPFTKVDLYVKPQ